MSDSDRSRFDTDTFRKLWLGLWIAVLLVLIVPLFCPEPFELKQHVVDFRMRYNEAACIREGRDPYLVWNGTLPRGDYVPWSMSILTAPKETKVIHAYPPWEYAWMLPFTFLPVETAESVYKGILWCALFGIVAIALGLGWRERRQLWAAFAVASAALLAGYAMEKCLIFENFGILIAFSVLAAALCHRRGLPAAAGVFWAFTLVKPQLGVLFLLPLLVRRQWTTLAVTAGITVAATLVSSVLCGRSPVEMILAIFKYSDGQFCATGFVPVRLYHLLEPSLGNTLLLAGSAMLGLVLCGVLVWKQRKVEDPLEGLMPPLFFATVWTAARTHDQSIYAVLFIGLALSALRRKDLAGLLTDVGLIVLILMRGIDDLLVLPVNVFLMAAMALFIVRTMRFTKVEL